MRTRADLSPKLAPKPFPWMNQGAAARGGFKRTYENMRRIYKENVTSEFKEEEFKDFVVGQLVDSLYWVDR